MHNGGFNLDSMPLWRIIAVVGLTLFGVGGVVGHYEASNSPVEIANFTNLQSQVIGIATDQKKMADNINDIKVYLGGLQASLKELGKLDDEFETERDKREMLDSRVTALEANERAEASKREARAARGLSN